jgi:quercetin dioxygenase-like cupin family protein
MNLNTPKQESQPKPAPASSDARRDLFEYAFPAAVTKVIVAKENCTLGKHYHKVKSEYFVLISGACSFFLNDSPTSIHGLMGDMRLMEGVWVDPGKPHYFHLKKGSILLGLCSKPYDQTDDYPVP